MEGRWFDVYLKTADNIFDVMLKKTSAFNRKSGGKILDPKNGKEYKCYIKLIDNNTLKLRGYIGISMFGRTAIWKRAAE